MGATGPSGTNGTNGATGAMGSTGAMGATGPSGAAGATGAAGAAGVTGAMGATGKTALVTTTPIGAGLDCPAGGTEINSGLDTDGDSELDPSEILETSWACNGVDGATGAMGDDGTNGTNGSDGTDRTDGTDGLSIVSRTHASSAATTDCPSGGILLETGTDTNKDGVLNNDEVDHSEMICNGSSGVSPVFNFTPIEKNGACGAYTGVLIEIGLDNGEAGGVSNNGVLESGEVDSQRALCVEKADLTVKGGGCSVSGSGASELGGFASSLSLAAAGMFLRRRRRNDR